MVALTHLCSGIIFQGGASLRVVSAWLADAVCFKRLGGVNTGGGLSKEETRH
jgi:hypothetical protein